MPKKPGGYHYGETVEIREFTLPCYFEDITEDAYEKIIRHFYRGAKGRLIFDNRPYIYYDAVVSEAITGDTYIHRSDMYAEDLYSATITIKMKAYDPFGKMLYTTYSNFDEHGAAKTTGILRDTQMPHAIEPRTGSYLIYNPGTETSNTVIRIAGTAPNGVTITNRTTGDVCKLLALPASPNHLEVDGELGTVRIMPADPNGYAFELHDMGYITLAPCTPYWRNVAVSYTAESNKIKFAAFPTLEELIGKYVFVDGGWVRIIDLLNDGSYVVNKFLTSTGSENTMIVTMNEIDVEGDGITLTSQTIDYVPQTR